MRSVECSLQPTVAGPGVSSYTYSYNLYSTPVVLQLRGIYIRAGAVIDHIGALDCTGASWLYINYYSLRWCTVGRAMSAVAMLADNGTANVTEYRFPIPDFVAYNVIMLVVFVIPVSVVNTLTVFIVLLDKSTPVPIRIVIVNLLAASLIVILGLYLEHLTALVLISGEQPLPSAGFCSFAIWLLAGGGACRLVFTAVFSVVVFVMVKGSSKAISKLGLSISLTILWIVAFLPNAPILIPYLAGEIYLGGAACFPQVTNATTNLIFLLAWAIVFGIIPLVITITMPLVTICYLQQHSISGDAKFKKAMVKFALFLILGILFNFLGQVVPPLIVRSTKDPSMIYLAFTLMNLSLIPTPVLIYIYLGGVRKKAKEILLCYAIRFRGESAHERSRSTGSVLSKRGGSMLTKTQTNTSIKPNV